MPGFEEQFFITLSPQYLEDTTRKDLTSTPAAWKADVRVELMKIAASKVGKLLLQSLQFHGRWIRIMPYWPFVSDPRCSADAMDAGDSNPGDGHIYKGSLHFSPEKIVNGTACAAKRKAEGGAVADLDEMLLHELVHGLRVTSEKANPSPPALGGGLRLYDDNEEFIAVLVTNIYASANGKRVLRGSHHGHNPMEDDLNGSFKFFQSSVQTYSLIADFCNENRGFCGMLSKVKAPFNPIRAYFHDPKKAERFSQNATAEVRDWLANLSALL